MNIIQALAQHARETGALPTDRLCEACGRDWRGDPECPTCGHVALLPICAWHESELVTRMAVASGHAVTHGLCLDCARRMW